METEDAGRVQLPDGRTDGSVRPNQADQLWGEPVGVQAGSWRLQALGALDTRYLRRRVALYNKPRVLLKKSVLAWDQRSDPGPDLRVRGTPELRRETSTMGIT